MHHSNVLAHHQPPSGCYHPLEQTRDIPASLYKMTGSSALPLFDSAETKNALNETAFFSTARAVQGTFPDTLPYLLADDYSQDALAPNPDHRQQQPHRPRA
jgi:hypothetical protein